MSLIDKYKQIGKNKRVLLFPYPNMFGSTAPIIMIGKFLKELGYDVYVAGKGKYMFLAELAGLKTIEAATVPYEIFTIGTYEGKYNVLFSPRIQLPMFIDDINVLKLISPNFVIHYSRPSVPIAGYMLNVKVFGFLFVGLSHFYVGPPYMPRIDSHLKLFHILPFTDKYTTFWPFIFKTVLNKHFRKLMHWANNITQSNVFDSYDKLMFSANSKPVLMDSLYLFPATNIRNFYNIAPFIQDIIKNKKEDRKFLNKLKQYKQQGKKVIFINLGSSTVNRGENIVKLLIALESINISSVFLISGFFDKTMDNIRKFIRDKNLLVFIKDMFNMQDIGKYLDLSIIQGGRGNLYDNIYYKTPMIVIPNSVEQEINGLTLKNLGIGDILYKNQLNNINLIKKKAIKLLHINKDVLASIKLNVFERNWKLDILNIIRDCKQC